MNGKFWVSFIGFSSFWFPSAFTAGALLRPPPSSSVGEVIVMFSLKSSR